jgi:hypothetical protein
MHNVCGIFNYRAPAKNLAVLAVSFGRLSGVHILTKMLSTPWCSRAVPQPSTDLALHRFAAEFGWDPAFSMQYGRQLNTLIGW